MDLNVIYVYILLYRMDLMPFFALRAFF